MRDAAIDDATAAIVALINSVPWTPRASQIANIIKCAVASEDVASSRLTLELRQRRQALHTAIAEALGAESPQAFEEACAKALRRSQELDAVADQVWRRPVVSWEDVVMRAEVALAYHEDAVDGTIEGLDAPCQFERSLAELLKAIAILDEDLDQAGGTDAMSRPDIRRIDSQRGGV